MNKKRDTIDRRPFTIHHSLFTIRGRTVYEALIVIIAGGILLVVAITTFLDSVKSARETVLKSELSNIRTAIRLYHMLNKSYPESLKDMIAREYVLPFKESPIIKGRYLESMSADKKGNVLDPFGSLFTYDRRTGNVRSSTKGYERW